MSAVARKFVVARRALKHHYQAAICAVTPSARPAVEAILTAAERELAVIEATGGGETELLIAIDTACEELLAIAAAVRP